MAKQSKDAFKLRIVQELSTNVTIGVVAKRLECSYFTIYLAVRDMEAEQSQNGHISLQVDGQEYQLRLELPPRQGRKLSASKRRQVRKLLKTSNLSPQEIKRQLGLRSTYLVYQEQSRLMNQQLRNVGNFHPKPHRHRCPEHGMMELFPCVQCEAERYKQTKHLRA